MSRCRPLITPQHPQMTTDEPTNQTTISIVSSSKLLRDGLAALLSAYSKLCVVGKYSEHTPDAIRLPNPAGHVVLLDGGLGHSLAIPWTLYWRSLDMPAHVVVMELLNDIDLILACIEAGASGYILRGASIDDVVETIDRVRCGIAQCSPEVTARLFARLAALRSATPTMVVDGAKLTPREVEVLRYIAEDYSNQEIANALVIEVRTVKHHVHNILREIQYAQPWRRSALCRRAWLA